MSFPCVYKGEIAGKCIHRRFERRKNIIFGRFKLVCRDPDRVARPEADYKRAFVMKCAGYKAKNE